MATHQSFWWGKVVERVAMAPVPFRPASLGLLTFGQRIAGFSVILIRRTRIGRPIGGLLFPGVELAAQVAEGGGVFHVVGQVLQLLWVGLHVVQFLGRAGCV